MAYIVHVCDTAALISLLSSMRFISGAHQTALLLTYYISFSDDAARDHCTSRHTNCVGADPSWSELEVCVQL